MTKESKSPARMTRRPLCLAIVLAVGALLASPAPADVGLNCGLPGDSRCEVWTARRDRGAADLTLASAVSPSGDRLFAAGVDHGSASSGANQIVTLAFDGASGAQLWERSYGGPGGDWPYSMAVSPSGSTVAIAGVAGESGTAADQLALAYDTTTGVQKWVMRFDSGGYDYALDLVWSPDESKVYVTGPSRGSGPGAGDLDYVTTAIDSSTGVVLWRTRTFYSFNGSDYPYAIAVSPNGASVAVTGILQKAEGITTGFGTAVYESQSGATRWVQVYDSGYNTTGAGWEVAFSADSSRIHVAGNAQKPGSTTRVPGTITYDTNSGTTLWSERAIEYIAPDFPAMAVNPVNGTVYFVTGALITKSNGLNDFDFLVIAYNGSNGSRRWVTTYDSALNNQFIPAIAVPADGQTIAITGTSQQIYPQQVNGISTISLGASTGTLRWDARFGLPLDTDTTLASKFPISTAGNRIFIGRTVGKALNFDYMVAAYDV